AGVLAPITTPFDSATGEVAPVHLRHNVTRLVAAGLDGVVVGGSTGESALLDPDEQRRMVGWVREVLPDKRWLIAGTGGGATSPHTATQPRNGQSLSAPARSCMPLWSWAATGASSPWPASPQRSPPRCSPPSAPATGRARGSCRSGSRRSIGKSWGSSGPRE